MNNDIIKVVKCFTEGCLAYTDHKPLNKCVVDAKLNECYAEFRAKGYMFLNDVFRKLDFPLTREGQIAGWIFDSEHAKQCMWTVWTKRDKYDKDVYITFECLSNILDVLPKEKEGAN